MGCGVGGGPPLLASAICLQTFCLCVCVYGYKQYVHVYRFLYVNPCEVSECTRVSVWRQKVDAECLPLSLSTEPGAHPFSNTSWPSSSKEPSLPCSPAGELQAFTTTPGFSHGLWGFELRLSCLLGRYFPAQPSFVTGILPLTDMGPWPRVCVKQ